MKDINDILVSIVIPTYKSKYLKDAIKSAINQTHQNIEIIIVNDKSPQPITEIINEFNDKRIKYYINETNLGKEDPSKNWNKCLSYAQGEYIALLCDDDLYSPDFVEKLLNLAVNNPNSNVFRARVQIIDKTNKIIDYYPSSPTYETCEEYMWHVFKCLRKNTISEFLLKKEHLIANGLYENIPLAWGSDYFSIFKLSKEGGIISTTETLVIFRMSGENISSKTQDAEIKLQAYKIYVSKVTDFINKNFPNDKYNLRELIKINHLIHDRGILVPCSWYTFFKITLLDNKKYDIKLKRFLSILVSKLIYKFKSIF